MSSSQDWEKKFSDLKVKHQEEIEGLCLVFKNRIQSLETQVAELEVLLSRVPKVKQEVEIKTNILSTILERGSLNLETLIKRAIPLFDIGYFCDGSAGIVTWIYVKVFSESLSLTEDKKWRYRSGKEKLTFASKDFFVILFPLLADPVRNLCGEACSKAKSELHVEFGDQLEVFRERKKRYQGYCTRILSLADHLVNQENVEYQEHIAKEVEDLFD
jgi:hypothetical protein